MLILGQPGLYSESLLQTDKKRLSTPNIGEKMKQPGSSHKLLMDVAKWKNCFEKF
jgi:hypothetical protein